ncbi:actin-like protein 9-like [Stylonychia lemnae]|uniref:Actin-like protein 9-like n=1 Tax=Stylonychia lemnae TaxID=5949 RepID=A0A077ZR74_STYLE|nr:actin-like protein 9-like [Stylonychia lemnae]|eukprot:CDW71840.1 actin-like protein 9-like [Stylonychia lemnae]
MQKAHELQQQRQGGGNSVASIFNSGIGGASMSQQIQQQDIKNPMNLFNPFGMLQNKADGQQQKDFRRLESYIVKSCVPYCLKKERNYHCDIPHIKEISNISFAKTRLDKRIQQFIDKSISNNPFGQAQIPVPMYKGRIIDMDSFEYAWSKVIDEFLKPIETLQKIGQSDNVGFDNDNNFGLLMSEPSINITERFEQREDICQIAFESLNASKFAFVPQASLKLFAELKYSGMVVDFGADMTQISPVENGYTSFYSADNFKVNGQSIDKYLLYSLQLGNGLQPNISNILNLEKVKSDLKENLWDDKGRLLQQKSYMLPDKTQLIVNQEKGYDRDALAFLYFNSEIIKEMENSYQKYQYTSKGGPTDKGFIYFDSMKSAYSKITELGGLYNQEQATLERKSVIYKILKCLQNYSLEENINKNLIETVLLTGGGIQLSNLGNLVQMQLETKCIDEYSKINVVQQKEPANQILQGAKLYASMKHLDSILISKAEYQEEGAIIVNKKCY